MTGLQTCNKWSYLLVRVLQFIKVLLWRISTGQDVRVRVPLANLVRGSNGACVPVTFVGVSLFTLLVVSCSQVTTQYKVFILYYWHDGKKTVVSSVYSTIKVNKFKAVQTATMRLTKTGNKRVSKLKKPRQNKKGIIFCILWGDIFVRSVVTSSIKPFGLYWFCLRPDRLIPCS